MRINLVVFLLCGALLQVSLAAKGQTVNISKKDVPLTEVLKEIRKQTGYDFVITNAQVKQSKKVSVTSKGDDMREILDKCFAEQPFTYVIESKVIIVKPRPVVEKSSGAPLLIDVNGRVVDADGNALMGASIKVKNTAISTVTNSEGAFMIKGAPDGAIIQVTFIGYEMQEVKATENILVHLSRSMSKLDEVVVIPYGTTTARLNTGSVSRITANEIEKQPVGNPLATLAGRMPGLTVVQNSGMPGSGFAVNVRGRTSINTNINNDPLFIIDGVPFATNNNGINELANAGRSPFNSISPADIESIEILKDADATSIYGSRGANGVVLITTKKGKEGKVSINANVYAGVSAVTKKIDLMNTEQYIQMRKEAFANDGVAPTSSTAPDLLLWDTNRYTDWQEYLIGSNAKTKDATFSISGGNKQTQFLIGGAYHTESTVFSGGLDDSRSSVHFSLNHQSVDNRFKLLFTGSFGSNENNLDVSEITASAMSMVPNGPSLIKPDGSLNYNENGVTISNPLATLRKIYEGKTNNYLTGLNVSYEVIKGLFFKSNVGYNKMYYNEFSTIPIAAQNPANNPVGFANFANSDYKSFVVEPQLQLVKPLFIGKLDVLMGGSWQRNQYESTYILASGYTSDALLGSLAAAGAIDDKGSNNTDYKYAALFGRINYNIKDRYILNLTGRRDGSSRFGPANSYANFGAIGAAWIFSNENMINQNLGFLSFGKLKGSYGTTGNDKIGDYKYIDTWTSLSKTYQGKSGLYPTGLFNPDYRWEINKKLEIGLDLGFLKDRILVSTSWYSNRSSNQLISYTLPAQTGGSSITANFPATVQNTGFEFSLNTTNLKSNALEWTSTFNISLPKNKLVSFPGIESTTYNNFYLVGRSLGIKSGLTVNGVNPTTGVYEFVKKDGSLTSTPVAADATKGIVNLDPKFYGGLANTLRYKGFQLDLFFEFKKQDGINLLGNFLSLNRAPGRNQNMPTAFLDRWTTENTNTNVQKFTANTTSAAYKAANSMYLYGADLFYSDASYIRLKNMSFSYTLPQKLVSGIAMKSLRFYAMGQNLLTISHYFGGDPEIQTINRLPPLRTITFGIQGSL